MKKIYLAICALIDISHLGIVGIGALFVVFGNMAPKSTINHMFGIRTPWSMSSDQVWQKTQRSGGYVLIAAGLLIIICGLLLNGLAMWVATFGIGALACIICVVQSYRFYKKDAESSSTAQ